MRTEEIAALVQRYRMREDAADRIQLHSRRGNHIVADPQIKLAVDEDVSREQKVEMLGHGTGERVLDRDDRSLHRAVLHAVEYLCRAGARYHGATRQHSICAFVTERPEFALDCDFHNAAGYGSSFLANSSFTRPGLACPLDAFITCP